MILKKSDFSFEYPSELIAQHASDRRDKSRLLVRSRNGKMEEKRFDDISNILAPNSLIITNNTRVFPSRLFCKTASGGTVEIFLLTLPLPHLDGSEVDCLVKPFRKFKVGQVFKFPEGLSATVGLILELPSGPAIKMIFDRSPEDLLTWCSLWGTIPLPPYIKRPKSTPAPNEADRQRYQTVYAKEQGSVAAPTAGLHFTEEVFQRLKEKGIRHLELTLHVGAGTFLPVKSEDISEHFMHTERFFVSSQTWNEVLAHKDKGGSIVAVGTTSFRTLESLARMAGDSLVSGLSFCDQWQSTDLFIRPKTKDERYVPRVINTLVTNFHQPESTLFMLICALLGYEEAHRTYRWAIEKEFQLFSYGDSSILEL
ncbi:MAG: tRNA preQ1(34) S-adenosylmethionine ribosyltransferase-isomerase QueA [Pseudomonadota bacterium]